MVDRVKRLAADAIYMIIKHFSLKIIHFHGLESPEAGLLVGYGAIIEGYGLAVSIPNRLALISSKKRKYTTEQWQVLTSRDEQKDSLYDHLVFALKYEGINPFY